MTQNETNNSSNSHGVSYAKSIVFRIIDKTQSDKN